MRKLLLALIALALLSACQKQDESGTTAPVEAPPVAATEPAPARQLLGEPLTADRLELPSEALPYWRDAAGGSRPALVLFSIHPFLTPLDPEQLAGVQRLLRTGLADDFHAHGSAYRVDPIFVSTQSVSAALAGGLFSRLIWVFPSMATPDQLSLEKFRTQVVEAGFLSEEEGAALQLKDGAFVGTVRGIPFSAVHPMALQELSEPAILHLDLSFFKGMYKNEIKTPLYPLLNQLARELQPLNWQVRGATLSSSTVEGELSLETRFLINRFAALLERPALLKEDMPEAWNLHSEALYTINFFLESKVDELYQRGIEIAPNDPALLYGKALRVLRKGDLNEALALIERAVAVDPGYAFEYLGLADQALEKQDLDNGLRLLDKGMAHFPENPFLKVQKANLLLRMGRLEEGRALVKELQKLPWSPAVHADMPQVLAGMLSYEPSQEPQTLPKEGESK